MEARAVHEDKRGLSLVAHSLLRVTYRVARARIHKHAFVRAHVRVHIMHKLTSRAETKRAGGRTERVGIGSPCAKVPMPRDVVY